ncbi:MAG TPA: PilC/PilY family type IV pilus protein [Methyloversatilis sp.]
MNPIHSSVFSRAHRRLAVLLSLWMAVAPAHAATSISDNPLILNVTAAPNVIFILDNSGSMLYESLPDAFNDTWSFQTSILMSNSSTTLPDYSDTNILNVAMRSAQLNRVYYNPNVTYRRWTNADGTQYANSSPTNAKSTPEQTSGGDLTAQQTVTAKWITTTGTTFSFSTTAVPKVAVTCLDSRGRSTSTCPQSFWPITYYVYKGTGSQYEKGSYYRYQIRGSVADKKDLADGTVTTLTSFSFSGGITRTIDQEKQNFANWYTYSRTRFNAAKNGVTAAFSTLGENYRVGYRPLNPTVASVTQLEIPVSGTFSSTNRSDWFTRLLGTQAGNSTPLRTALAKAGEYYRTTTGSQDPWGPADDHGHFLGCRQSFTIMTTDGYYNDSLDNTFDSRTDTTIYGVKSVNGNIGNADGDKGRPYADTYSWTLADIAMFYYKDDMRTDISNKVPTTDEDPAAWQHMVTFGVSFGLQGSLDPETDLPALKAGTKSWPDPSPSTADSAKLDDMWHATVNGRGKFVSATNSEEFAAGLKGALDSIVQRTASASNLGVSSSELREGSKVFQARFTSAIWTGDVWAYSVGTSGLSTTPLWKASEHIPAAASRNIFTRNGTAGISFLWDNLSTTQKTALNNDSTILDYLRGVRSGEVDEGGSFRNRLSLLGDIVDSSPVFIGAPDNFSYERFSWDGASTYQTFRSNNASRAEMLYVGANDGMMHAFNAATGAEQFAYVPSAALSSMKDLASTTYTHRFINDGSLRVADVFQSVAGGTGSWKTVLVGSQGRGGRQVYALDVTDPASFDTTKVLWEFTDSDFGKFIGKPVFARMNNGRWAVLLGNGYNSDQYHAFLFVIDAVTGELIRKIDTGDCPTGETPCLSNGLADITPWDDDGDGNADFAYAGDLRGNLWRFDLSSATPSEWKVAFGTATAPLPLYRAKDASGNPQPITSNVEVMLNPADGVRWISFGTGRFLTETDRADTSVQTWYGLYDNYATGATTSPVTGRSDLAQRVVLFETDTYVTGTTNVNPNRARVISAPGDSTGGAAMTDVHGTYVKKGWYLDLVPPSGTATGERMFYGTQAFSTALFATTAVPDNDPCSPGGNGWLMSIDPFTGGRLNTNVFVNRAVVTITNPDGSTTTYNVSGVGLTSMPSSPILVRSDPNVSAGSGSSGSSAGSTDVLVNTSDLGILRERLNLPDRFGRMSWRELIND